MADTVKVSKRPKCDLPDCDNNAYADCKTIAGCWANLCRPHFMVLGVGLGTGKGQKFVVEGEEEKDAT